MRLLLDEAAVVDLLLRSDAGERVRRYLVGAGPPPLLTVAHLDAEVLSALARLSRAGELRPMTVTMLLDRLGSLAIRRLPITAPLLSAAWALRDNVAARDALYVAAARAADAGLVTTDERLARAVPELVVDLA